jgi:hypothetical protein
LGMVGHGALECVPRVAHVASTALLGASVAGYRGHACAWRTIPSHGGSLAGPGASAVSLVASGPRGDVGAGEFRQLDVAHPTCGRAVARSGTHLWRPEDGRAMSGDPQAAAGLGDVRAACRGGADPPCGRAGHAPRRALAQGQLWDPQPGGLPVCRRDDDGGGHAHTTASPRPRLSDRRMRSDVVRQDGPFLAAYACRDRTAPALRCIARP